MGADEVKVEVDVDWVTISQMLRITHREMQVLRGIWHGRKYTQIGRDLGISKDTVDTHWRHIKAKLGVSSHIEAVHRVYKVVIQMRLQAAIAPLEQAITDVQRQVNQLQEQIEQMGKEQGVEKTA